MRALSAAERSYSRFGPPTPYAKGAGKWEISRGQPGADQSLRFKFVDGDPIYRKLTSAPLAAIVTVDRKTSHILGVKFVNRGTT
jgi:hypothetical protein